MLSLQPRSVPEVVLFSILGLASYADLFLQGVLSAQFVHYLNVNQRDSLWIKLFVAGLAVLTTLKSMQILAVEWLQDAGLFESLEAVTHLWYSNWLSSSTIILGALIAFYVQMFFCHRLWVLSHNVALVAITMILFIFALASASVSTHFFTDIPLTAAWYATFLGFTMGGDLLQTGGIVFHLLRHSKDALARGPTASMLNSLLRMTIQSAAPSTICAFTNFVATAKTLPDDGSGPQLSAAWVIAAVTSVFLPKLYAVAAMWTLNTRDEIRSAAANPPTSPHFETTDAALEWGSGPRPNSDIQSTHTLTEGENGEKDLH
ncbi:hypothetical protein B0H12DRAFT_1326914 [Mycena haematopus]|nr:hypothetical protein B0H12DRAFT_1326914 [Mycena haematopus]